MDKRYINMKKKIKQENSWSQPNKQVYNWSQPDDDEKEESNQEETAKASETQTETPQDHKAEMGDLYLIFPSKMDKLLERLDGREMSGAEVSRELDKLIAEKEERERSIISKDRNKKK